MKFHKAWKFWIPIHQILPTCVPSGKLTWQWKMDQLKMYSLLKMGVFHCHVSLLEGNRKHPAVFFLVAQEIVGSTSSKMPHGLVVETLIQPTTVGDESNTFTKPKKATHKGLFFCLRFHGFTEIYIQHHSERYFFAGFVGWILSESFRNFHTVDGTNPANQLRLVLYPFVCTVLYIPTGSGFLPSTVPFHNQGPSPLRKLPPFSANFFLWPGDCEPRLLANDKTIQFLSTWMLQEVSKWLVLGF